MKHQIEIPKDWTAIMDIAYFEERWGESQNYSQEVFNRLAQEYIGLSDSLDSALTHLQDLDPRFVAINPRCLSFQEKVARLTMLVRGSHRETGYPESQPARIIGAAEFVGDGSQLGYRRQ